MLTINNEANIMTTIILIAQLSDINSVKGLWNKCMYTL